MFGGPSIWTQECVNKLKELWQKGLSCSLIGEQLNISRNAVIGKAHRLKLGSHETTQSKDGVLQQGPPRKSKQRGVGQVNLVRRIEFRKRPNGTYYDELKEPPRQLPFLNLSLLDLKADQCRYPQGDGPFTFCAQPVVSGTSYCEFCNWLTRRNIEPNKQADRGFAA